MRRTRGGNNPLRKLVEYILLFSYFAYPFGCKLIFGVFNCITVDSVRYLRADLRINCDLPAHNQATAFGVFMIAAFPVGLPAIHGGMLYANRHPLYSEDGDVSPRIKHLRFFFGEYKKHFYFWEVVRGTQLVRN
jgi:hypothetical protein